MCGIYFTARFIDTRQSQDEDGFRVFSEKLKAANSYRGPDAQGHLRILLRDGNKKSSPRPDTTTVLALEFFVAELQLRGSTQIVQPHEKDGDVLCWNGEVFGGMDILPGSRLFAQVLPEENDGVRLLDAIQELGANEELIDLLGCLEGPYAFVLYRAASQKLFFGLDPLGRRSLLMHKPTRSNPYFLLSSVSGKGLDFEEVHTSTVHCIDMRQLSISDDIVAGFHSEMTALPRHRVDLDAAQVPPYAKPIKVNSVLPPESFAPLRTLDHIPEDLVLPLDHLISHLDRSVMLRVRDIPYQLGPRNQARVAVLFSGGIDSTVLALLAHRNILSDEHIDLINVAFENPRKSMLTYGNNVPRKQRKSQSITEKVDGRMGEVSYEVPDRITGLQELEELKRLCPDRVWNFVAVNVPYEESQAARPLIESLMWPRRTTMDLSLSMALYFAARGRGQLVGSRSDRTVMYTSPARVLLSGLGSDELLGGYGRHRTAFKTGGWQAVIDELQLEVDRIPTRNLGRDDRVISSHGREVRQPFLSLDVVSFLAGLPVHHKTDPRLALGLGDKLLLRLAARKLGLVEASQRQKRAMQFGSHSARMVSGESERRGDLVLS